MRASLEGYGKRLDRRHFALAEATLKHDQARGALQAAGFTGARARRRPSTWLCGYYEAAEAEEAGAQLIPVEAAQAALVSSESGRADAVVDAACLHRTLSQALLTLPPHQERIIRLLHFEEHPLAQVAEAFGATRERIRQVEQRALRSLRRRTRSNPLWRCYGAVRREPASVEKEWSPRGLSARAALQDAATPTWVKFRLIDVLAPTAPMGSAAAVPKLTGRWSKQDFARVQRVLGDAGSGAKALRHARTITPCLVQVLARLPAPLRIGRIASLLDLCGAELLARAVARMQPVGPNFMHGLSERLSRARSRPRLFQMVLDEMGAPPASRAPALATDWLRPLRSVQDLERAAIEFRNCLRGHIPRLLAGNAIYFEALTPARAIVQIARDGSGRWFLREVAGPGNTRVDPALHTRLKEHLSAHQIQPTRARRDDLTAALLHASGMQWG